MENCIVNKLKGDVRNTIPTLSSIRLSLLRGTNTNFITLKSLDSEKANTYVKSVDNLVSVYGRGQSPASVTNMGENDGYIYIDPKSGVVYPCVVMFDLYPKWNFEEIKVNHLEDLDASMVNLKKVTMETYTPSDVSEYVCSGNVEVLRNIPSLEYVNLYAPLNNELVTGDLGKLGTLVNLTYLHTHNAGVYGDLADALNEMYANGRTSGELVFRSAGTKVVLTYNGNQVRIGAAIITHQDVDVYGWRISFSSSGWSVAETYNTYIS